LGQLVVLYFLGQNAEGRGVLYVMIYFPLLWIVSGIILICMIKSMKIRIDDNKRLLLVLLSTPLPLILLFVLFVTYSTQ
jgi:hypothetical protein